LIFGLPGQTLESFDETLRRLIDMSPTHISAYSLKLEPDTPLYKRYEGADEDTDRELYHLAAKKLNGAGYSHYETSNFAKPGFECRHNLKYWLGEEYLGLGVAAYSYLKEEGGHRFGNVSSIDSYLQCIVDKKRPTSEDVYLTETDQVIEYIMLRLRLKHGIDYKDYRRSFGSDFFSDFGNAIETAQNTGLITADSKEIRPTLKGFDLQNTLIGEFIKKL
jgi:oxygen-independent coproporphyrinogen-3 oxidase